MALHATPELSLSLSPESSSTTARVPSISPPSDRACRVRVTQRDRDTSYGGMSALYFLHLGRTDLLRPRGGRREATTTVHPG